MAKKVIAITACTVGVAHTYMAAENLEKAGEAMDIDMKVETHGSVGIENNLTEQDIEEAEGLIIAADTEIDKSRFAGKQIIEVGVQKGIKQPENLINGILNHEGKTFEGAGAASKDSSSSSDGSGRNVIYRSLMNGVSYMVPFIVTGGLLIAVALSLGGVPTEAGFVIPEDSIWFHINNIGNAAMGFMVPILAGYIGMSIADRPGLVPGMVGGYIAVNGSFYGSEADAGFIGGIIAGFLAGYIALAIKKIPVPKAMQSVMPVIFIPVLSSLAVGLIFIFLIGAPVASLFTALTNWLTSLEGASTALLAAIIGAMIAVDMGGPFNKVAFLFGSGLIVEGTYSVMGAVAVAVCIPPLALGLAAHLFPNKFAEEDKQAGTAAIAMGFFGITEGAIPFAAKDPLRVIPSVVVGSIVGSIIAMLGGVGGHVAHGGPIVALLGAIDNVLIYAIAVLVGVAVTLVALYFLKEDLEPQLAGATTRPDDVAVDHQEETIEDTVVENTNETTQETTEEDLSLVQLTDKEFINMNLQADYKNNVIEEMITEANLSGIVDDKETVIEAVLNRESQGTTGMGGGIAIPHAKSPHIHEATVLFGRSQNEIEWESLDGTAVQIVFLILVPEEQKGDVHLKILQMLARRLVDESFTQELLEASSKDEVYELLKTI
jgi:PTS system fructose-specific IIC component